MPVSDFVNQMFSKIGQISQQYPTANVDAINQALGQGGSLQNSLGFNEPSELMGLTPEMFQKSMDMRTVIQNNLFSGLKQMTDLSDSLSGNKEARAAAYGMVPNALSSLTSEEVNRQGNIASMERTQLQEAGATQRNNLDNQTSRINSREGNATQLAATRMQIKSHERIAAIGERGAERRFRQSLEADRFKEMNMEKRDALGMYGKIQDAVDYQSKIIAAPNVDSQTKLMAAQEVQRMMPNLIKPVAEGGRSIWNPSTWLKGSAPKIEYISPKVDRSNPEQPIVYQELPNPRNPREKIRVKMNLNPYEYYRVTQKYLKY